MARLLLIHNFSLFAICIYPKRATNYINVNINNAFISFLRLGQINLEGFKYFDDVNM